MDLEPVQVIVKVAEEVIAEDSDGCAGRAALDVRFLGAHAGIPLREVNEYVGVG